LPQRASRERTSLLTIIVNYLYIKNGICFYFSFVCWPLIFSMFFPSFSSFKWIQIELVAHTQCECLLFLLYSPLFLFIDTDWIADIILLLLLFLLLHLARNCNALLSQLVVALTVKWQIAIKPTKRIKPLNRMNRMIHSSTCAIFALGKKGITII